MTREEILMKANECVTGKREQDYGTPESNFSMIANLWNAYTGFPFSSVDVAIMLGLLKIARIKTGKGIDDCFVDLAGYAACAGECQNAQSQAKDPLFGGTIKALL